MAAGDEEILGGGAFDHIAFESAWGGVGYGKNELRGSFLLSFDRSGDNSYDQITFFDFTQKRMKLLEDVVDGLYLLKMGDRHGRKL